MILIILLLIFILTGAGFYIDMKFSKPKKKMHPAGYEMVPKKVLQARERAAWGYDDEEDDYFDEPIYFSHNMYSEAQQYQREVMTQQANTLQEMRNDYYKTQEALEHKQFWSGLNETKDLLLDTIGDGINNWYK